MKKNIVLITGASTGIGRICAEYLADRGFHVYGTTRKKELLSVKQRGTGVISMIYMDVTDAVSVENAVMDIIKENGYIDIVINNAGSGMAGAVEDTSYEEASAQFETNFFGCIRVINTVLPHMRKNGSGLIINIGSVVGYIPIPFQAIYSATKAALLSLTRSLRNETAPFGIKVCIVQPGDLKTNFTANRIMTKKSLKDSAYENRLKKSMAVMEKDEKTGGDPVCVAKTVYRIIKRKRPPVSVTVGFKYKIVALLFRILPEKLREYIIASIYA